MNLGSPTSTSAVNWTRVSIGTQNQQPLTWYKANFDAPEGDEPLALDMRSMGKGQVWINGESIGRYWIIHANGNCSACSYSGTFRINKCQFGCLQPTQQWYHVPRSWLKPSQNLLVVFEELAGDVSKIDLVKTFVRTICAKISKSYPLVREFDTKSQGKLKEQKKPKLSLECKKPKLSLECKNGHSISAIKFSSFGTPSESCGNYKHCTCHAPNSTPVLNKRCIGKQKCSVTVSNANFGMDPCLGTVKKLFVEAICAPITT